MNGEDLWLTLDDLGMTVTRSLLDPETVVGGLNLHLVLVPA